MSTFVSCVADVALSVKRKFWGVYNHWTGLDAYMDRLERVDPEGNAPAGTCRMQVLVNTDGCLRRVCGFTEDGKVHTEMAGEWAVKWWLANKDMMDENRANDDSMPDAFKAFAAVEGYASGDEMEEVENPAETYVSGRPRKKGRWTN